MRVARRLGAAVISICVACSLAVDNSELDSCTPPEHKVCGGQCVRVDDPLYGCSRTGCDDTGCGDGNHGILGCDGERCVYTECLTPWGCPPGCNQEILTDEANCGGCGVSCDGTCLGGRCVADAPE